MWVAAKDAKLPWSIYSPRAVLLESGMGFLVSEVSVSPELTEGPKGFHVASRQKKHSYLRKLESRGDADCS